MQLTDKDIREFVEAWKEAFEETLTAGEARNYASQLMALYFLLAQPLPDEISEMERREPD